MPVIRVRICADPSQMPYGINSDGSSRFEVGETYDLMRGHALVLMADGFAEYVREVGIADNEPPSRPTWYPRYP